MKATHLVGGAALGLILTGAGCSSPVSVPIAPGVTTNGNTTTYQNDNTTVNVGQGTQIPSNFPTDVPQYKNSTVTEAAVTNENGAGATLGFTTPDAATDVSSWYDTTLKAAGWTSTSNYNASGSSSALYTKGTETLDVTITAANGEPTNGLLIWQGDSSK